MDKKIASIRARFEAELASSPESGSQLYHPIDIARVRDEEWQVKRYLLDTNENEDQAFRNMTETLRWKRSFGVHDFDAERDCPRELNELFRVEIAGPDRDGRVILSESFKEQRYYSELDGLMRQMVVSYAEKVDRLAGENGATYLGDFSDTPLSNVHIGLTRFRVEVLNQHYAMLMRKLLLVGVPFLLRPVIKLIVSFMKQSVREAVENVSRDALTRHIDRQALHVEQGGTRDKRRYPADAPSIRDIAERNSISQSFIAQWCETHGF